MILRQNSALCMRFFYWSVLTIVAEVLKIRFGGFRHLPHVFVNPRCIESPPRGAILLHDAPKSFFSASPL